MPVIVAETAVVPQATFLADLFTPITDILFDSGLSVRLFVNDIEPDINSVLDDFVEATFNGYASHSPPALGTPSTDPSGRIKVLGAEAFEWVGPNDDSGEVVYGYYVSGGSPLHLIFAYRFPTPVGLMTPTDVLTLVVGITVPPIA